MKLDAVEAASEMKTMEDEKEMSRLSLCGGRQGGPRREDCDRLLVFFCFVQLFIIFYCVKSVATGNIDMNYLSVICEIKIMPV